VLHRVFSRKSSLQEFALSETHTAPLPPTSGGVSSPLRGSQSLAPFSVEGAIELPLPTSEPTSTNQMDSARDMHPSPQAPAAPTAHTVPLLKEDMPLARLGKGIEDTVTPVTSARAGPSDSPTTDQEIPAPAPQFSAASLVQAEESESSVVPDGPPGDSATAALSKRHPDWPADEPTHKVQLSPVLCLLISVTSFSP
jgi:hypothetical protein